MLVYALTIFTGAFLLFQVQPLIGKYILPWFGGGPGVWTTCLLFFQMLLLGGYAYAHFSARWLKPRAQAIAHLILLITALALLPITPSDSWKPTDSADPTLRILALLLVSIGLPYFALAATSPLLQHWFSRTQPSVSPYRLFALSNAGSLLALISFPVFFETHFTRKAQAALWDWGLVVYAVGCGLCAAKLWRASAVKNSSATNVEAGIAETVPPTFVQKLLWLLLPACASVLLLATTNRICQEVAVIPFLWVLPLSLYLLSFIICFDNPRWYARFPFALALIAAMAGICWALFKSLEAPTLFQISIYCGGLFICCMVCHGELCRLKPDPRHLTGFYLTIAAGGALGGLFVAVIAPLIFTDYFELHWGLLLCGLLFLLVCARDRSAASNKGWRRLLGKVQQRRRLTCVGLSVGLVALGVALELQTHQFAEARVYRSRNFYGVLTIFKQHDNERNLDYLVLWHGRTMHGMQFLNPQQAAWPSLYYSEKSGVGLAMHALPAGHRRIGLVGLGVGTLATYAQVEDYVHIYEINPEVQRLATSWFTYLTNCPAKVETTLGDARLSLEREPPQDFDLLALDAFNSDAIPVHLLTKEAFVIYERHLKTNGVIAVHVSNKSVNLEPVVINLARHFNYKVATIDCTPPADKPWILGSVWMLLSRNAEFVNSPTIRVAARPADTNLVSVPLWTDDFASLFQILRLESGPQKDPEFTDAQFRIAYSLWQQRDFAGAIARFRFALRSHPRSPILLNNLAFMLAICPDVSQRNNPEAIQLAERACVLTHYKQAVMIDTLAAAYAEAGRFDDAISMAEKVCALATESEDQNLLKINQELLVLYRAHKPYHDIMSPGQAEPSAVKHASGDIEKLVPAAP